jgi:hypothetical protein
VWYNEYVKRTEMSADQVMAYLWSVPKPPKKNKKNYRKPLDKPHKVWYNKDVPKRNENKLRLTTYCQKGNDVYE